MHNKYIKDIWRVFLSSHMLNQKKINHGFQNEKHTKQKILCTITDLLCSKWLHYQMIDIMYVLFLAVLARCFLRELSSYLPVSLKIMTDYTPTPGKPEDANDQSTTV